VLFTLGDVVAQVGVERRRRWQAFEPRRTARLAFYGGCVAGPALTTWYRVLELHVRLSTPVRSLLARVALDQALFAPLFLATFFTMQSLMTGRSLVQTKQHLASTYFKALANNYKLWPAVQLANFYLVPLRHRLMVVNTVALGWNTYLSVVQARLTA